MIIKLCKMEGITPICTVRREEQAKMLVNDLKVKHVFNTSESDWKQKLGMLCMKTRPSACLECVSGEMTGAMCDFLGFGGTVILYGTLSEKPACARPPPPTVRQRTAVAPAPCARRV